MYSFGIKNVMAHMWFGTGIGNYGKEMKAMGFDDTAYAVSADPHNLFYELAGVFGIVWAVLLIILLLKLLVFYFKKTNVKDYIYYLGLVYIVIFVGFASSSSNTCLGNFNISELSDDYYDKLFSVINSARDKMVNKSSLSR